MSSNPREGGRLEDMAVDGTTIPSNSAQPRYLKSVPRPDQLDDSNTLGQSQLSGAADNSTDMPRRNRDVATTGEVVTGTGDQLPAQAEQKRMNIRASEPLAKGHGRYHKHHRQNESDFEWYAGEGAGIDEAPGDEGGGSGHHSVKQGLTGPGRCSLDGIVP